MNNRFKLPAQIAAQMCGILISVTALVMLCGYAVGVESIYTWKNNISMALPTALLFLLTGVSIFILGTEKKSNHKGDQQ